MLLQITLCENVRLQIEPLGHGGDRQQDMRPLPVGSALAVDLCGAVRIMVEDDVAEDLVECLWW